VASAASGKVKLTDIADNTNEEAIQVAYDLNIVEGTPEGAYEPEKAINRAEFAALITRALAIPESALASYTGSTFKDTSGYGWAIKYLAFCQEKGIMKGDGYGNAMPGRTINPNEAVTMVLRAVGYTDNASVLVGQWPANYVSLGQSLNLYEKVSTDVEMNKAAAAQMLYNSLTVQLVQVDANSTVLLLYDSEAAGIAKTLLTTGLNCYRDRTGADYYDKKIVSYTDAASSKINLVPKVGAYGILYRSNVDKEVVALTETETVFLTGKFTYANAGIGEIDKFKAVDGTVYNLSIDAKEIVNRIANGHYNNVATTASGIITYGSFINGDDAATDSVVGNYVTKFKDIHTTTQYNAYRDNPSNWVDGVAVDPPQNSAKLIIAASVSGVTVLDLRSVAVWDAYLSGQGDDFLYESGQVDGKKFNGHDLPLDVNNEVDDYGYVLAGVNSLEDLATDNVVYIYKNKDKKIARIDVGTETQSGAITNINSKDGQRTIGGKVLGDSPYHHSATWADLGNINNEGTALLDIYGRTYAFRLGEASKGNFAVVTGSDANGLSGVQYKIFDKTGKDVIYGVTSSAKYYNSTADYYNKPNPISHNLDGSGQVSNGTLVQYKISNGKLHEVVAGTYNDDTIGTSNNFGTVNAAGTIISIGTAGDKLVDSSVLVYVADDVKAVYDNAGNFTGFKADYSVGSIKDLQDGELKNEFWYFLGSDGKVKALIVNSDDAGAQNVFVLINSITKGSDGAGGEIDVVNGLSFADGASASGKTWSYNDSTLHDRGWGRYGMVVKFRIGEDGVLKAATDLNDRKLYDPDYDPETPGNYDPEDPNDVPIENVGYYAYYPGNGGTFSIEYTSGSSIELVTFEASTVLYKVDGSNWVAMRPTEGNFKADQDPTKPAATYTFLKTDPDKKAYDIIIKTN
jgi:hypothetical protein